MFATTCKICINIIYIYIYIIILFFVVQYMKFCASTTYLSTHKYTKCHSECNVYQSNQPISPRLSDFRFSDFWCFMMVISGGPFSSFTGGACHLKASCRCLHSLHSVDYSDRNCYPKKIWRDHSMIGVELGLTKIMKLSTNGKCLSSLLTCAFCIYIHGTRQEQTF